MCDARLYLADAAFYFPFGDVFHPRIDGLEPCPVNCGDSADEKTKLPAQINELRANSLDGGTVVFSKVGDRLEIWRQSPCQPHQLDIAACFALQAPARLNAVEIAIEINLQQR